MKEVVQVFEGQFTCSGENTEKYMIFSVPMEKEVTRINKKGGKSRKLYLTDHNLVIPQDLWQSHYHCCLKYTGVKYYFTEYNYQKVFDKNLEKWPFNSYIFSNHDINNFTSMLWMIWMIDITVADYT